MSDIETTGRLVEELCGDLSSIRAPRGKALYLEAVSDQNDVIDPNQLTPE